MAADVEAKREANLKAKDEARKKQVEEIKATKEAKSKERADAKAITDAEAAKKKASLDEVEAKRAANVKAKEEQRGKPKPQKSKYSQKDVHELKQVFDQYDTSGDGKIELSEFTAALRKNKERSAPKPGEKSTKEQRESNRMIGIADTAEGAFNAMDGDKNGSVTFAEMLKLQFPHASPKEIELMMSWVAEPVPEPEPEPEGPSEKARDAMKALFKKYDKNKSGTVDVKELKTALGQIGVDPDELEAMLAEYDANGDKQLDLEEFVKLMASTGAFDD